MAKWGEGDPRWIVEERPDATNVNNWHWTEKNATPWSKDKLKQLLEGLEIKKNGIHCRIKSCEKLEGEATANNRKGKLIFFYEWDIVLKWEGKLEGDEKFVTDGKATIPNLSEENDIDEVEITISIDESNELNERIKAFMYNVGRDKIREQLDSYVKTLKLDFAKGLILPSKDGAKDSDKVVIKNNTMINKKIEMQPVIDPKANVGVRIECETINITESFRCRAAELYDALTNKEMVAAFTRGDVKMEAIKGGEFQLFGGNISGKFDELVPHSKITQTWRYKQWPGGHHSHVTLELSEQDDHTELKLTQTSVPVSDLENTKQNWSRYYFESIKRTFGFGTFLY
ncbi:activator of 90 kDa heat shock protein ATPase homolog 1 [Culicoides brevitarsis]|uniref:activator of 90 kDa heat shock protein ATPase homolog 1 n=1 Tax=Culicoides brevitarsis TaxID=469753 RepID=UPI00307C5A26